MTQLERFCDLKDGHPFKRFQPKMSDAPILIKGFLLESKNSTQRRNCFPASDPDCPLCVEPEELVLPINGGLKQFTAPLKFAVPLKSLPRGHWFQGIKQVAFYLNLGAFYNRGEIAVMKLNSNMLSMTEDTLVLPMSVAVQFKQFLLLTPQ